MIDDRPDLAEMDVQTHRISIVLSEEQATAMASGYMPNSVKAILKELLDWELIDDTRAARPVPKKPTTARQKATR